MHRTFYGPNPKRPIKARKVPFEPLGWAKIVTILGFQKSQFRLEVLVAQKEEEDPFLDLDGTDDELSGRSRKPSKGSSDSSMDYEEVVRNTICGSTH